LDYVRYVAEKRRQQKAFAFNQWTARKARCLARSPPSTSVLADANGQHTRNDEFVLDPAALLRIFIVFQALAGELIELHLRGRSEEAGASGQVAERLGS
jgi:hypothetical protein